MFARSSFSALQPLRNTVRRYATESSSSGSSNTILYATLGALACGGGYYYYSKSGKSATPGNVVPSSTPPSACLTGGDQGWVGLKLASVENINHNTKKFRFEFPDKDNVSGMHITSALLTKFKGPEMQKPVIRPYTPVSDEDQCGYLDLIVKVYPNGPMSEHMHSMIPGQQLDFKGPLTKYPWVANKHSHITLIAGGTGITPMYQLARAIFKNPEDKTKVTLVFGNIAEEDILLKKEFQELENTYPQRFRAFYLLDNPPKDWAGGKGFITKELLKTVLPEPKEQNIKVFVCGPPGLYKAVSGGKVSPTDQGELTGILKDLGYSKDQVFKF
ncbi:MAG: NADH-cytochrome b5 reductase [Cirrosporium novae-zelandiae]|nr:MAG: NADH-cytochrome b5 reductase [Cirrosporium novae-zelandiae]